MKLLIELYQYRELLKSNIKKEIRGKYKGSFLGVLWSFISPLLMVAVYALIFPILLGTPPNYYVYLITGILPWTFFTSSVAAGTTTVIINANLIKKVYFPREILPISVVLSGLVSFLISCLVIVLFLIISGIGFSVYILYFPVILIISAALTMGFVFLLSAINVYVRDVEYIVNFLLLLLMYLTPIIWEISTVEAQKPEFVKFIFLNPVAGIIDSYHNILYYQASPNFYALGYTALFSVAILVIGYATYRKLEKGFAEEM